MNQQQRATRTVLPLKAAIYHAVHDIRGGVGAIAGAYGYNVNTMWHKISLTNDGRHVLTVPELAQLERDAARLHATIQTLISTARARMEGTA